MGDRIATLIAKLTPAQVSIVEQAFLIAAADLERRVDVDDETAEELAEQILIEALRRESSGFPLRNRWDAEAVALIVADDVFGSDFAAPLIKP